ncbi:p53 and DNA damage-regulated protein 1-like [Corticium candelabrum]|uniref:p53 and DNA damage-regulated protein 1-like n=1 Tax=Corticium candelabrum TaxID=121492 RepID=UPI002E25C1A4|nr:p53 and DNA damage-regulated protein 1-like [Corticium candelabrum]
MDSDTLLQHVISVERRAEDILADKQQVVDLDRKRNANREALRALKRSTDTKTWTCFGNTFIKFSNSDVDRMLRRDQETLNSEITALRDALPTKVNELREMEGKADARSFARLKALSREEVESLLSKQDSQY